MSFLLNNNDLVKADIMSLFEQAVTAAPDKERGFWVRRGVWVSNLPLPGPSNVEFLKNIQPALEYICLWEISQRRFQVHQGLLYNGVLYDESSRVALRIEAQQLMSKMQHLKFKNIASVGHLLEVISPFLSDENAPV